MLTKTELIVLWILATLCFAPVITYVGLVAWEHWDDTEYPFDGFCPDSPEHFD